MKVTVVGAGNVGATCANCIAEKDIVNEVVLLDIKEGVAEGKSLDMWQTAPINLYDTRIKGVTNDYEATNNSEVVVITSGLPRKPGMSPNHLSRKSVFGRHLHETNYKTPWQQGNTHDTQH